MSFTTRHAGDTTVVALDGDIDLESSPLARAALLEAIAASRTPRIVADLSAVTYIDSSGVASLVEALQKARGAGKQFALAAVSEPARRVLELARLDRVFTLLETPGDALP
jgi:anti-sigma B factor antagonist